MREEAHRFGRARHLVGIAGVPEGARGQTGVIVLNAGLVHRIGPFRLNLDLVGAFLRDQRQCFRHRCVSPVACQAAP